MKVGLIRTKLVLQRKLKEVIPALENYAKGTITKEEAWEDAEKGIDELKEQIVNFLGISLNCDPIAA